MCIHRYIPESSLSALIFISGHTIRVHSLTYTYNVCTYKVYMCGCMTHTYTHTTHHYLLPPLVLYVRVHTCRHMCTSFKM